MACRSSADFLKRSPEKVTGYQNIDFEQFRGCDIGVTEFTTALEPILRFCIEDVEDPDDDGWVLAFIGVIEVELKPEWEIGRFEIQVKGDDMIECRDPENGFRIICRDISLISGEEAWCLE